MGLDEKNEPANESERDGRNAGATQRNAAAQAQEELSRSKRSRMAIIAVACGAACIAIAVASVMTSVNYHRDLHTAALATCSAASSEVTESREALAQALKDSTTASGYSSRDVADPNTLNDLEDMINRANAISDPPTCSDDDSTDDLRAAGDMLTLYNENVQNLTKALQIATKSVESSHQELQTLH